MNFDPPFQRGVLLRRYKRFLADIECSDGQVITVHCPNTGAMTGCAEPGSEAWYSKSDNPKRKYPHTLEVVCASAGRVGVNTGRANELVAEALIAGRLAEFSDFEQVRREVRSPDGLGRFDVHLSGGEIETFVEVKSLTLLGEDGLGYFPDAVSTRALKHLDSLMDARQRGYGAALVFCVQHTGVSQAAAAEHIYPEYAARLKQAAEAGVQVSAYGCTIEPDKLEISQPLPVLV